MVKCSYCESDKHNISDCNIDNDLDKILYSTVEPDFNNLSLKVLKKIAALTGLRTCYPKIQLVLMFKVSWRLKQTSREEEIHALKKELQCLRVCSEITECPICMEELGIVDCCTTKCGHKYCSNCFIKTVIKKNKCPMCREPIMDNDEYIASFNQNNQNNEENTDRQDSGIFSLSTTAIEGETYDMLIVGDIDWSFDDDDLIATNRRLSLSDLQTDTSLNRQEIRN